MIVIHLLLSSQSNYRIKELNLSHNEFAEAGGEILGLGIGKREEFDVISFRKNTSVQLHGSFYGGIL